MTNNSIYLIQVVCCFDVLDTIHFGLCVCSVHWFHQGNEQCAQLQRWDKCFSSCTECVSRQVQHFIFFSTFFRYLFYSYFPGVDQQYFPASYHHPEIIANRVSNLSKRLQQVDCSSLTSVHVRHYFHSLSQLSRAYTTVSNNKSIISYGGCCCYCWYWCTNFFTSFCFQRGWFIFSLALLVS